MRLHRLELTAFGPFPGRESIDFEPLNEAGLFLLNGVTGAGKTSVLDALCFALYGSVPGARTRNALRSDHAAAGAEPAVELEFTAAGRRFRLARSPYWETPSARAASGTAVRQPRALLMERGDDGEWAARATRLDDVGEQVREVVGLSQEQFTQVILLPQGEFARFLRAGSGDREALLKRLFGTGFYERVQEELAARSRAARAAAEATAAEVARLVRDADRERTQLRSLEPAAADGSGADGAEDAVPDAVPGGGAPVAAPATTPEPAGPHGSGPEPAGPAVTPAAAPAVAGAREDVLHARRRATAAHEALGAGLADAERRAGALREEQRLRSRLDGLRAEEAELARLRPAAERDRSALRRHAAAAPLRVLLDARLRARDRLAAALVRRTAVVTETGADERVRRAAAALPAGRGPALDAVLAGRRPPEPASRVAADQDLAAVRQARGREPELARLARDVARLREELREAERTCTDLDERAAQEEAERADLVHRVGELTPRAGPAAELARAAEDAARVLEASRELADAAAAEILRRDRYRRAEATRREAARGAELLQQRRFEQAAGLLAAGLAEGTPCPVCGSVEHPAPADAGGAAEVTDEALRAALAHRDATARDAEQLRREHEGARDAVVRLRAGGATDDPAAARSTARGAAAAAEEARAAERERAQAQADLELLGRRSRRTQDARHEAVAARSAARARLGQIEAQHDALAAELTAAARGFTDLAAREDAAERLVAALARLTEAHDDHGHAVRADAEATGQLRTALGESGFAGEDELAAALLSPDDAERCRRRVDDHDRRMLRVGAELAAPELAAARAREASGAPGAGPEELTDARDEVEALRERRDGSTGRLARLASLLERLDVLAEEAAAADAAASSAAAEAAVLRGLADTANATSPDNTLRMTLNSFVLAAQLEEVAAAASARLERMTGGRYRLVHTDAKDGARKSGLGLEVEDAWTNARRGTGSLSGGETFMASLALALGLADVVQARAGGVEIDTLFVDEGFGSLDEETLEEVMDTIDGLRDRGRVIGLVSHVQELKSRIPHQIRVHRSPGGSTLSVLPETRNRAGAGAHRKETADP